jgi:hypothetical protein
MALSWDRPIAYGTDPKTRIGLSKEDQSLLTYRGIYWKWPTGNPDTALEATSWGGLKKTIGAILSGIDVATDWPNIPDVYGGN